MLVAEQRENSFLLSIYIYIAYTYMDKHTLKPSLVKNLPDLTMDIKTMITIVRR